MPKAKSAKNGAKRKAPRVEILRLAERLQADARRTGDTADAAIADVVTAAWLLEVRGARGIGSAALVHDARSVVRTANGRHVAERAAPKPVATPTTWLEALRQRAASLLELGAKARYPGEREALRAYTARALVEYTRAMVPGVAGDADTSERALRDLLVLKKPTTAAQLARLALAACRVDGRRVDQADARDRVKRQRTRS